MMMYMTEFLDEPDQLPPPAHRPLKSARNGCKCEPCRTYRRNWQKEKLKQDPDRFKNGTFTCHKCGIVFKGLIYPESRKTVLRYCSRRCAGNEAGTGTRVNLRIPGHPLATSRGQVANYRRVVYEIFGAGEHPCEWCGEVLGWDKIVVDHFDENPKNDDVSNLVLSCHSCNCTRSRVIAWEKKTGKTITSMREKPDRIR